MKVYNKFVHSIKEPSNKSDIWFDGSYWRMYTGGQWTPFTISTKVAKKVEEYANNLKLFNIVDVLPEKGVEDIIYLLIDSTGENTTLIQYTYINNSWEELGSFTINVNLEDYVKKEEILFEKGSAENSVVLKGGNNQATNTNEVALGKYNISNSDTQFSIGIGTSDTDRKNAFEVKQNGDIYVEGVEKPIQQELTELSAGFEDFAKGVESVLENQSERIEQINTELSEEIASKFAKQNTIIASGFEKQDKEIEGKANTDGKYPQLTSGFASNLVGRGESTESEFSFRASGGKSIEDGTARISELRGNGVVWNQLLENGDFSEGKKRWSVVGGASKGTFEVVDGVAEMTITSEPTSGSWGYIINDSKPCVVGHKYLISADINIPKATNAVIYGQGVNVVSQQVSANTWTKVNGFHVATRIDNFVIYPHALNGGYTTGDVWKMRNFVLYDLTLMFGAGKEPTTIEEFYARMPIGVDEYAYNEGTLIPFNADAIKSVGFNAWDKSMMEGGYVSDINGTVLSSSTSKNTGYVRVLPNAKYYIRTDATSGRWGAWYDADKNFISGIYGGGMHTSPSNAAYAKMTIVYNGNGNPDTFCINLSHTGYRNGEYQPYEDFIRQIDPRIREAFPNGMKSAGTASDRVYNKNGKGIVEKRIVEMDLGNLNWKYETITSGENYYAPIADIKRPNAGKISARYPMGNSNSRNVMFNSGENLNISADGFNGDAAAFKAAMAGVTLYYELAEPEIIEYDEPFNLDYEVWDFGTEEIISEQPSAPISADIIYQFNAVDTIRNNQIEIAQLKAMIATMQAQMASLINKE